MRERHVAVMARGASGGAGAADVAWFDERLYNEKLGDCRGTGVLVRDASSSSAEWRIAQYNLLMAIPNEKALDVARLARGDGSGQE